MAGAMGPDSFALNSGGNVVLRQSNVNASGPQTQLSGSGGGTMLPGQTSVAPGGDYRNLAATSARTIDALNSLTQGALRPMIEAEQKRMYFDGMSRVAQGTSLMDIEKEQPWYSKIFGPSATVQGAQAMSATTALTQAQTDFMTNMPQLRMQSPDAVRQYLVDQASNIKLTGDGLVDSMVQAKLAESWGPMMKTHMKEHLAWQQEDMLNKQVNLSIANGENLKASRNANQVTGWDDKAREQEYQNFVESSRPAPGQPIESWRKGMSESLRANLSSGNFDAYYATRNSDLWNQLDPVQRTQLESQVPMYVQKDALTNPNTTKLFTDRGGLEFQLSHGTTGMTHSDLDTTIDGFNARNQQATGGQNLMDNQDRERMHKMLDQGNLVMGKQLAALQSKQAAYDQSSLTVAKAFNSGNTAMLKGLPVDEKAAGDFMNASFNNEVGSGDPTRMQVWFDKAAQSSHDSKLRSPQLEGVFQTQLGPLVTGNGPATPAMQQALSYAAMLYHSPAGGAGALGEYLDKETAPKVVALLQSGADLKDPDQLRQVREVIARGANAVVGKDDKEAAAAYVSKADPSWWKRVIPGFGPGELTPFELNAGNKQALIDTITPQIAQYSKAYHIPPKDAAPMVLSNMLRNADVVPGAFIFHNPAVPGDTSFSGAVNRISKGLGVQSTSLYQSTMKEFINERLSDAVRAGGGEMDHFDPNDFEVRSGEQLGNGRLMLFMSSKKYPGLQTITLDAGADEKDTHGFVFRLINNAGKKPAPGALSFGPDNTFLTKERMDKADAAYAAGWK